jgi:hypothetical protein
MANLDCGGRANDADHRPPPPLSTDLDTIRHPQRSARQQRVYRKSQFVNRDNMSKIMAGHPAIPLNPAIFLITCKEKYFSN